MIREVLLPQLRERFPQVSLQPGPKPEVMAVFPAASVEVGDLTLWDDGDEVTFSVGSLTHGHYAVYDETVSSERAAEIIAGEVISFLDDFFSEQMLLWVSPGGAAGFFMAAPEPLPSYIDADDRIYAWSGPLANPVDVAG